MEQKWRLNKVHKMQLNSSWAWGQWNLGSTVWFWRLGLVSQWEPLLLGSQRSRRGREQPHASSAELRAQGGSLLPRCSFLACLYDGAAAAFILPQPRGAQGHCNSGGHVPLLFLSPLPTPSGGLTVTTWVYENVLNVSLANEKMGKGSAGPMELNPCVGQDTGFTDHHLPSQQA